MIPRKGKSISLNEFKKWKISYGCLDFRNPLTVYIKIQTWLTPISEDSINNTSIIYRSVSNYKILKESIFDTRFIQNVSFAETKMKVNKQTCLVVTLSIKQKENVVPFNMIQPHIQDLLDDFTSKMEIAWEGDFKLSPSKKTKI